MQINLKRNTGNFANEFYQALAGFDVGSVLLLAGEPGTGSTIYDFGGTNNGTITGAVWKQFPSGLWYLDCVGGDDLVLVGTNLAAFKLQVFTVLVWFKTTGAAFANLFSFADLGTTNYGITCRLSDVGVLNLRVVDGAGAAVNASGATAANDGKWHLAAYVKSAANAHEVMLDGVSDGTNTTSITIGYGSNSRVVVGAAWNQTTSAYIQYFTGQNTLVSYLSTALSVAQVAGYYQQTKHLIGV